MGAGTNIADIADIADTENRCQGQMLPDQAVEWLLAMPSVLGSVCLDGSPGGRDLQPLVDAARIAQSSLGGFITRVGLAGRETEPGSSLELLQGRARSVRSGTARRDAQRVEAAAEFDRFTDGAASGLIGGDQLDSLARAAKRLDDDERAALNTPELAAAAVDLPADEFDRRVKAAVQRAQRDHGLAEAVASRERSEFTHWFDPVAGMGKFRGQLDPERYEMLHTAVDREVSALAANAEGPTKQDEHLAAAALVGLVTSSGQSGHSGVPTITIVVDEQTARHGAHEGSIRQTVNGHSVPPETIQRIACDATLRRVVLDERGVPIDVGRRYRTATEAQWTAIKAIHATCGWDGCDRPITWCQLHHIHEWEHGGSTDLNNLVPLCSRHHHQVHEGKWSVRLRADRSMEIYQPDGVSWAVVPIPTRGPPNAPLGGSLSGR